MKTDSQKIVYFLSFLALILFIMFALLILSIKKCAISSDNRNTAQIEASVMKNWLGQNWKAALEDSAKMENKYFHTAIKFDSLLLSDRHKDYLKSVTNFLDENSMYSRNHLLIKKSERHLCNYNNMRVLNWCKKYPPKTYIGKMAYLNALISSYGAKKSDITQLIKNIWINYNECSVTSKFFIRFSEYLTKADHVEKINHILLNNELSNVEPIAKLLNDEDREIVNCRVHLKNRSQNAIQCYKNLMQQGVKDYGLIFDFLFHCRKNVQNKQELQNNALMLMNLPIKEQYKKKIISLRLCYSRELVLQHDPMTAYNLLKGLDMHHNDADYIKINHLAGFICLAYLKDFELAKKHFLKIKSCCIYPSDISRNCYFLHLCYKNANYGKGRFLSLYYLDKGAKYPITFYGQICMMILGRNNINLHMEDNTNFVKPDSKIYINNVDHFEDKISFLQALIKHNKYALADIILTDLIKDLTKTQIVKIMNQIMQVTDNPNCQMMLSNSALNRNVMYVKYLFPEYKIDCEKTYCDASLINGIIRKESVFNINAISNKNAFGLMQITSNTIDFCLRQGMTTNIESSNVSDIKTNISVGSYFLNFLQEKIYNGNLMMTLAAYNCGREKVRRWNLLYGPLYSKNDIFNSIKWVETIPFFGVQEYVKSVIRNKNIYFALKNNGKLCIMDDFNLKVLPYH